MVVYIRERWRGNKKIDIWIIMSFAFSAKSCECNHNEQNKNYKWINIEFCISSFTLSFQDLHSINSISTTRQSSNQTKSMTWSIANSGGERKLVAVSDNPSQAPWCRVLISHSSGLAYVNELVCHYAYGTNTGDSHSLSLSHSICIRSTYKNIQIPLINIDFTNKYKYMHNRDLHKNTTNWHDLDKSHIHFEQQCLCF